MNLRPHYRYALEDVLAAFRQLREEFANAPFPVAIAYAVKAAPFAPVVATVGAAGGWAEVMCPAELALAEAARIPHAHRVIHAPAADPEWLLANLLAGSVVVAAHLPMLEALAYRLARPGEVAPGTLLVRVHDGGGATSLRHGVNTVDRRLWSRALGALDALRPRVSRVGLHVHSRKLTAAAFRRPEVSDWLERVWSEVVGVAGAGVLDLGGGWGADDDGAERSKALCMLASALQPRPVSLIVEPGARLVAAAGGIELPAAYVDEDRRELIALGGRQLLPELRDGDGKGSSDGLAVRGPSCMGSDRLPGVRVTDVGQHRAISIAGVGAYNAALALGQFSGGGRDAAVVFRGLDVGAPEASEQLDELGWTLVRIDDADSGAAVASSLGLCLLPGDPGGAVSWHVEAEIWATVPHTDGARIETAPEVVCVAIEVRDPTGAGVSSVCSVDHVVAHLYASGQGDVVRAAERARVPIRGLGALQSVLWAEERGWCARLFRPAVDWSRLAHDPKHFDEVQLIIAWLERAALENPWRVDLVVDAGQCIVIDNRRSLHWRSGLGPDSPRRGFRRMFNRLAAPIRSGSP